ncbi:MAG: amino acid ABC transporter permease [Acholeplasmataceae bacterium]
MELPAKNEFLKTIWYLLYNFWEVLLRGLGTTLLLALVGTIGGFFISFIFLYLKTLKIDKKRDHTAKKVFKKIGNHFASAYISVVRGTPMIVQAIIIFYGIAPYANNNIWTPLFAGLLIITFNTAAYIAEIIRSGINAIDPGQQEAARSLGFSNLQAKIFIVYPQAIKNSLPSIGNEFIVNLKDSSVLFAIGVMDLYNAGNAASSGNYRKVETFIIVAIIYLILTVVTSRLIKFLESKRTKGGLVIE